MTSTFATGGLSARLMLAAALSACSSGPSAPRQISNVLYVANFANSHITAYAANATGNAAPVTMIGGSNTGLSFPWGIARDTAGRLYVANLGTSASSSETLTVYAPNATGNAAPIATIAGSNTGLHSVQGIAVSAAGQLYVVNIGNGGSSGDSITVYAANATGNAAPIYTIAGSNTGLSAPWAVALDAAGRLFVSNAGPRGTNPGNSITVYAANATGNAAPIYTIAGSNTGLSSPESIVLDDVGQLYVLNVTIVSNVAYYSITVYAPGASGNAAPTQTITGSNTGLSNPVGMAVDGTGKLHVANFGIGGSITVYAPGATGNAAPIITIAGNNTGLFGAAYITF